MTAKVRTGKLVVSDEPAGMGIPVFLTLSEADGTPRRPSDELQEMLKGLARKVNLPTMSKPTFRAAQRLAAEYVNLKAKAKDPNRKGPISVGRRITLEIALVKAVLADVASQTL